MRLAIKITITLCAGLILVLGSYSHLLEPRDHVVLATTTSLSDSGLLDFLEDEFESKHPEFDILVVSVGTGRALEMGKVGDADVVIVHNRELEEQFVREGHGTNRVTIMYNEFILVGPKHDPAGVRGQNITFAFQRIVEVGENGNARIVSRGDKSGTHVKEMKIWNELEINPRGESWYIEASTGMGGALRIAYEKDAYILLDSGTWSALGGQNELSVLVQGDPSMLNPYSAILIDQYSSTEDSHNGAEAFIIFLISEEGQQLIESFRINEHVLFKPIFGQTELVGLPEEEHTVQFWRKMLDD